MTPFLKGYSLILIPGSWAFGVWRMPYKKTVYALGPFRFAVHYMLGAWKPEGEFEPRINGGSWLKGPSPSEKLTDGTPAGGALEPVQHNRYDASGDLRGWHLDEKTGA